MEKQTEKHINVRKAERVVRHRKQQQEREAKEKLLVKLEAKEQQKRRDKQRNHRRNEERDMRRTEMVAYHELKHQYSKALHRVHHGKERDGMIH